MAVPEAATVLTERWTQLLAELDDADRNRLRTLSNEFEVATVAEQHQLWRSIIELATTQLPRTSVVCTEVNRALAKPRLATGKGKPNLPLPPGIAAAGKPPIHKWILAAPAESAASVRRRGTDPELPGLIRLRKPDGLLSLPLFQFTRTGDPEPLVLRINQLLGADADPWGAADWWLCPNIWLAGTPADLLGVLDDHLLVAAAVVAVEG
jgi:hypothetical protein